jgi:uncharacterized protein YbaA (DUF1428 family)
MTYVEGFVVAVPEANRAAYLDHAARASVLFKDYGIARHTEAWGTDVPDGTVTDFRKAVQAQDGEAIVFAWFEYPDRAARDAANARMMSDPRMHELGDMPFDGKRMIMGGFETILDTGSARGAFVDGFVLPVPRANRDAYLAMATQAWSVFVDYGALRLVEAFGDDVQPGKMTDFYRAVKAEEGEGVVFSWIEWPDRATRDEAWTKMMEDERMKLDPANTPFDGKRMFWGGFELVFDTGAEAPVTASQPEFA